MGFQGEEANNQHNLQNPNLNPPIPYNSLNPSRHIINPDSGNPLHYPSNEATFNSSLTKSDLPPVKKPASRGSYLSSHLSQDTNHTSNFKILSNENRVNELESKILVMEQNQIQLLNQIKSYDLKSEILKNDQTILNNSEQSRHDRVEKLLNIVRDQSNMDKTEMKSKIELIEEVLVREEKFKQEQRERDFELYKVMISNLTEKVSETVKVEVEARFKADLENKLIAQNITQKLVQEIDLLKSRIEEISVWNTSKHKDSTKECSDRAAALSKYIDLQLSEKENRSSKENSSLKDFVSKLTIEVKNNIQNQDTINEALDNQINKLSEEYTNKKNELDSIVKQVELRTVTKVDQLKNYIDSKDSLIKKDLNLRIDQITERTDKNFSVLVNDQLESREILAKKIENIETNQLEINQNLIQDIEQQIIPRMESFEEIIKHFEKESKQAKARTNSELAQMQMKLEIKEVNDRILRNLEYNELNQYIDKLRDDVLDFGTNVQFDMGDMIKDYKSMFDHLNQSNKLIYNKIGMMESATRSLFEDLYVELEKNQNMTTENIDKLSINILMNEMIAQVEMLDIEQEFENKKTMDKYLDQRCDDLRDVLIRQSQLRDEDQIKLDVDMIMMTMMNEFDKADQMAQIAREFKQTADTITNIENNAESKFKDIDEQAVKMESHFNSKISSVWDTMRTKKDIEDQAELDRIQQEIQEKKISEEFKDKLLSENQRFRELLEVKTITDEIMNRLEFNNVYDNFHKIDKKFLRYDDSTMAFKTKFTSLESKTTKLESSLGSLSSYVDQEILTKVLVDDMVNKVAFDNMNDEIKYAIRLREDEERDMELINKLINNKAKETENKIQVISEECKEDNNKRHEDALENMDSKVEKALEKIKKDNVDMWAHSIVMQNKIVSTEEVRKIIKEIPPVIVDKEESMKKIWELEHSEDNRPKPNLLKARGNIDKMAKEAKNKGEVYGVEGWKDKDDNKDNKDNKGKKNPKASGSVNVSQAVEEENSLVEERSQGRKGESKSNKSEKKEEQKSSKSKEKPQDSGDPNSSKSIEELPELKHIPKKKY